MVDQRRVRICLVAIIVVAGAGAIDALASRIWDLAVLLCIVVAVAVVAIVPNASDRITISIRRDLSRWLQQQSSLGGESVEQVTDRAIATYRSQWSAESDPLP